MNSVRIVAAPHIWKSLCCPYWSNEVPALITALPQSKIFQNRLWSRWKHRPSPRTVASNLAVCQKHALRAEAGGQSWETLKISSGTYLSATRKRGLEYSRCSCAQKDLENRPIRLMRILLSSQPPKWRILCFVISVGNLIPCYAEDNVIALSGPRLGLVTVRVCVWPGDKGCMLISKDTSWLHF